MNKKVIVSSLILIFMTLVVLFTWERQSIDEPLFGAPRFGTERYWQDVIHEEIGGQKEHRLDDGTRVDLLFPHEACEIDWANKWAEGVGQSIYYGLKTRKAPLVLLLVKKDGWEKYRDRVQYCGVNCWVYDTRTQQWLDKD